MLVFEVLIWEVASVDAFSGCTIALDEIPCLDYQIWNYPVEMVSLVVKPLPLDAISFFTGAQLAEVL